MLFIGHFKVYIIVPIIIFYFFLAIHDIYSYIRHNIQIYDKNQQIQLLSQAARRFLFYYIHKILMYPGIR